MTAARSPRSAALFVGSTSGTVAKVQSAGSSLSRLLASPRVESVPLSFRSPFEQPAHLPFDRFDAFLEGGAVAVFLELLPGLEDGPGELEAVQAEGFLRSESEVGAEGEVAAQV